MTLPGLIQVKIGSRPPARFTFGLPNLKVRGPIGLTYRDQPRSSIASSAQIYGASGSLSSTRQNQFRSTSAMWRTSPCNESFDVGTGRDLRNESSRSSHLRSSVVRWNSSQASSILRSFSTYGGSSRRVSMRSSTTMPPGIPRELSSPAYSAPPTPSSSTHQSAARLFPAPLPLGPPLRPSGSPALPVCGGPVPAPSPPARRVWPVGAAPSAALWCLLCPPSPSLPRHIAMAPSAGLEPAHTAPEADALSAELRGRGGPAGKGRGRPWLPLAGPSTLTRLPRGRSLHAPGPHRPNPLASSPEDVSSQQHVRPRPPCSCHQRRRQHRGGGRDGLTLAIEPELVHLERPGPPGER